MWCQQIFKGQILATLIGSFPIVRFIIFIIIFIVLLILIANISVKSKTTQNSNRKVNKNWTVQVEAWWFTYFLTQFILLYFGETFILWDCCFAFSKVNTLTIQGKNQSHLSQTLYFWQISPIGNSINYLYQLFPRLCYFILFPLIVILP